MWAGLVALGLTALPIGAINTGTLPLVMRATPGEFMGRVIAVISPANKLGAVVSVSIAGWLASTVLRDFHATVAGVRFGPLDTIFLAAGVLVLLAGLYALVGLRGVDRQPAAPAEVHSIARQRGSE